MHVVFILPLAQALDNNKNHNNHKIAFILYRAFQVTQRHLHNS